MSAIESLLDEVSAAVASHRPPSARGGMPPWWWSTFVELDAAWRSEKKRRARPCCHIEEAAARGHAYPGCACRATRRYLVFPPELADGQAGIVADPVDLGFVADALRAWLEEATPGESLEVRFCEMKEEDFENLGDRHETAPEI